MSNSNQTETRLSQWDALMLESLKSYGWPDGELLRRVYAGNLPKDESKFQFDYAGLVTLAKEQPDTFEQAVKNGYRIKYNTLRGIHSWIFVALKQEADLILEPGQEAVIAVLSDEEARLLASVLSFGWQLNLQDDTRIPDGNGKSTYRIEPIQR